ncbi:MAG: GNAT family N-acetyltransferase [Spirochaetes bacterium]|nr:GNAT family N-acetyltransferase [Spirochaetota bacterium]
MDYILSEEREMIPWQRVCELLEKVGWGVRAHDLVRDSFEKSKYAVFVWHGDKLVGFGRGMDDGHYYAMLVDIVIDPEHQAKGLGKKITTLLKDRLLNDKFIFITLTAAVGKNDFYRKLGWRQQKSAYIWPKDTKQADAHAF